MGSLVTREKEQISTVWTADSLLTGCSCDVSFNCLSGAYNFQIKTGQQGYNSQSGSAQVGV